MKSLILISLLNIKNHKAFFVKMIIVISCIVFSVTTYFTYVFALETQYNSIIKENLSSNYFHVDRYLDRNVKNRITETEIIEYKALNDSLYLDKIGVEDGQLSYGMSVVVLEGNQTYSPLAQSFEQMRIIAYDTKKQLFSQSEHDEFKHKNANKDLLLAGSYPKKADEILVNKHLLDMFGIDSEVAIHKLLSIKINNYEQNMIFENYKIVGIISENISQLSGYEGIFPSIVFSDKCFLMSENSNCFNEVSKVFLKDYNVAGVEGILKERNLNYNYCSQYSLVRINNIINQQILTKKLFSIISVALIIALLITLLLLIKQLFVMQSMNNGILLTCGIKERRLFVIYVIEILVAFFIAVMIGAIMNKAFMLAANMLLQKLMFIELKIHPSRSVLILVSVCAVLIVVLFMVSLTFFHKQKAKTIKELFLS